MQQVETAPSPGSSLSSTVTAFLSHRPPQPVAYRAYRHLEAENTRFNKRAWLEAVTEFDPSRGFSYAVTGQGGSSYILGRVLRPALDAEAEAVSGDPTRTAFTSENYDVRELDETPEGFVRLQLTPRRKERMLVDGVITVTKTDARVVRVEGRVAKNPSFWTTRVDIVRSYALVNGYNLPVELSSSADIRIAGRSEFRMTIRYESVAGQPLTEPQSLETEAHP